MPATPLKRRSRPLLKGDGREAALIEAAAGLLAQDRFEPASVAELAAAAGLSRPTFYFYFASKDALLASLIEATHDELAARLAAALRADGAPVARLTAAIAAAADTWWEHRAVMVAAMQLAHQMPELGTRMRASMTEVDALCVELLMAHGTVPEAGDRRAGAALVGTLALLNERIFTAEVAGARRRADLRPAERRLLAVWVRTLGLAP